MPKERLPCNIFLWVLASSMVGRTEYKAGESEAQAPKTSPGKHVHPNHVTVIQLVTVTQHRLTLGSDGDGDAAADR